MSPIEARIDTIVRECAKTIAAVIRSEIATAIANVLGELEVPPSPPKPVVADASGEWKAVEPVRKRAPILCRADGCEKPGRAPKYFWYCDEHAPPPKPRKAETKNGAGPGQA